jgi:hypothetical protein
MHRLLPIIFLLSVFSIFGLGWIVTSINPENAPFYIFALFVLLIFFVVFGFIGLVLYFLRTRLYRRYNVNWYIYTSFKMSFFVAFFAAGVTGLSLFNLASFVNITLLVIALSLFAFWSYLGRNIKD